MRQRAGAVFDEAKPHRLPQRSRRRVLSEAAGENVTQATALGFPDVIEGARLIRFARVARELHISRENGAQNAEVDCAYSVYLCGMREPTSGLEPLASSHFTSEPIHR